MNTERKIALLKSLSSDRVLRTDLFYETLEECGDLKFNYNDYTTTHPINCKQELLRLPPQIMIPAVLCSPCSCVRITSPMVALKSSSAMVK